MKNNVKGLYLLAGYFLSTGIFILFQPGAFYEMVPGLAAMGPFNFHFLIDVALVFIVSGTGLFYAAKKRLREVAVFAAAWPLLHAFFHAYIWWHRGFPFDIVWLVDFVGVVIPGFIAMYLATRLGSVSSRDQ